MAELFNCPSCGAPLDYDAEKQGRKGTISCPYCGESVIIPEALRELADHSYQIIESHVRIEPANVQVTTGQAGLAAGRLVRNSMLTVILIVVISAVVNFVAINILRDSVTQATSGAATELVAAPAYMPDNAQTQIAPLVPQVTKLFARVNTQPAAISTRTPVPTPTIDTTATAEVQATHTALNDLMVLQSNWPVVLQEKFTSNTRNWNTGLDNNALAIEDMAIAGGKYTWKMTSKKSMGAFSFPDLPAQKDLYISVDLQMATSNGSADDEAGIIFRHSVKNQSFYFFAVNHEGTYSLSFYDGSNWNDLMSTTQTSLLRPEEVNHLAISMQGDQILLMINDAVVSSYEDDRATSGSAGLGIYMPAPGEDDTFVFTNFYVRGPMQ